MTCSGTCPCDDQVADVLNAGFSDGEGYYGAREDCRWLVTAPGANISVKILSFNTESGYDFVIISECDSTDCNTQAQLAKLSGSVDAGAEYVSSTGFMLVTFTSDGYTHGPGFHLHWRLAGNGQNAECKACVPGKYSNSSTSTSCVDCAAGYFSGEGTSSCDVCPAHSTSTAGSAVCTCDPDYAGDGTSSCDPCPANSTSAAGSASCLCDAGFSSDGVSACAACEPGKYRLVSTVSCSGTCPCGVGEVGPSNDINGGFSDGDGDYSSNADCRWLIEAPGTDISVGFDAFDTESGYDFVTISTCDSAECSTQAQLAKLSGSMDVDAEYVSSTGFMLVSLTSDGAIQKSGFNLHWTVRGNGQNAECKACAPGKYSNSSAFTSCVDCAAGYFSGEGTSSCDACPAHSTSTAGSTVCTCDAGYFGDGTSSCDPCPAHSTSAAGSADMASCTCHWGYAGFNCTSCEADKFQGQTRASVTIEPGEDWKYVIENLPDGTNARLLPGLYQGACQVQLPNNIVLDGISASEAGADEVMIDCNSTASHFEVADGSCVSIKGVSLVNGKASHGEGGGCLFIGQGARVSLVGVLLENCSVRGVNPGSWNFCRETEPACREQLKFSSYAGCRCRRGYLHEPRFRCGHHL